MQILEELKTEFLSEEDSKEFGTGANRCQPSITSDDESLCSRVIGPDVRRVSTLAGTGDWGVLDGNTSESTFNCPAGICCLSDGTIFVADCKNNCSKCLQSAVRNAYPSSCR